MHACRNRGLALVACLSWVLVASPAAAQQEDVAATDALARDLFRQALEASEQGRWPEAVERYRRVVSLHPSPQVSFNLAQALIEVGQVVEASELLRAVQRDGGAPQAVREAVAPLLERAEAQTARLRVDVSGATEGVEVRLDERPLQSAMLGVAMPVDPGTHRLSGRRGDEEIASLETEVDAGAERVVTLELPARAVRHSVDAAALSPRPEDQPGHDSASSHHGLSHRSVLRSPWLWGALGVVVAGGVVAAVLATGGGGAAPLDGTFMPGRIEVGQ